MRKTSTIKPRSAQSRVIIPKMVRRDISERYRGSVLGVLWSLITPLMMLAVYTFVFGTLFGARWEEELPTSSNLDFAMILFAGLTLFQFFQDVLTRAPKLILSNASYVKKVVFPLETLVPISIGSALFHFMVSLLILIIMVLLVRGSVPITALMLPVVLVPLCVMLLGLGWALAAIGVYLRDIDHLIGTLTTAMMFLAPIFYPPSMLPDWAAKFIVFNPIVVPVAALRDVMIFGRAPDWTALGIYTAIAVVIAMLGYGIFQRTRKGFADVL